MKTEEFFIDKFLSTKAFAEGTTFKRIPHRGSNGRSRGYWKIHCGVCSEDAYVRQGLCSGVFTAHTETLSRGGLVCRCGTQFHYTQAQREFQLRSIMSAEDNGYSFEGWCVEYCGVRTRMRIRCGAGHTYEVKLNNFMSGKRCPLCSKAGYDQTKDGYVYVTLVKSANGTCFAGYGITNKPDQRLSSYKRAMRHIDMTVINWHAYKTDGLSAKEIEISLKHTFPVNPQPIVGFKTEATYCDYYFHVMSRIKNYLDVEYCVYLRTKPFVHIERKT